MSLVFSGGRGVAYLFVCFVFASFSEQIEPSLVVYSSVCLNACNYLSLLHIRKEGFGENLTNLMFADDVALLNESGKTPEQFKLRKPESWLKNTQRKDKRYDKPYGQRRHTNRSAKN